MTPCGGHDPQIENNKRVLFFFFLLENPCTNKCNLFCNYLNKDCFFQFLKEITFWFSLDSVVSISHITLLLSEIFK